MMIKKNITHPKFLSRKFLKDNRGSLDKFTDKTILKELKFKIVESQISKYYKNVFRGIYMQLGKYGEAKFIKLLNGKIIWFTIDLRKKSKTFGKLYAFKLTTEKILYTPRGFAHGSFAEKDSEALILADNSYNNKYSIGINYKDQNYYKKLKKYFKNKKIIISKWHNSYKSFEKAKKKIFHENF
jgi:dTDP-4-dehydrorhamnose 3,5-epimerase-like enzyme